MSETKYEALTQFLNQSHVGIIATVSAASGSPQSSVIYFIYDGQRTLYFVCAKSSQKLANIVKLPRVAVTVLHEQQPIEVQIEGTAQIVTEETAKESIVVKIGTMANAHPRSLGWPPLLSLAMNSGVDCIAVAIDRFRYSDFTIHPGIILEGTGKELLLS